MLAVGGCRRPCAASSSNQSMKRLSSASGSIRVRVSGVRAHGTDGAG